MTDESDVIRHVLFCVADQWRHDALGVAGTPGVRTPAIDAFAAESVRFTNHWCQASPCGPSRSSLLTGTPLARHGQWTNDDLADHGLVTLPAALAAQDVASLLVGYTDTPQPDGGLVDPAFEVIQPFVWQNGFPSWRAELRRRGYDLASLDPAFGLYAPTGLPDARGLAPAHYHREDSDMRLLTDAAIGAIGDRCAADRSGGDETAGGRSLLHVNWLRPHPPMTAPDPYHRLIDPDEVSLGRRGLGIDEQVALHPYFAATVPKRPMLECTQQRSTIEQLGEQEERFVRAAYYGLCAEVDHHFGLLIDALKEHGIYDQTLIVLTSDHGESLGDHWMFGRRGPFDGHFRVPCLVRDPRQMANPTRGTTVDAFTANIDIFPTICDGLNIAWPETVEGRSLLAHVSDAGSGGGGDVSGWRDHIRYDMSWHDHLPREVRAATSSEDHRFSAVCTDRYRYVQFPELPPVLFDRHEDPDETVNRAGDASLHATVTDLRALISLDP